MFRKLKVDALTVLVCCLLTFGVIVPAIGAIIEGSTSSGYEVFKKKAIAFTNLTQGTNTSNYAIPINSNGTIYSHSFTITDGDNFALGVKLAGNNTTTVMWIEQGATAPSTEGSADATWAVPTGAANISITNTTAQAFSAYTPAFLPYGRLKVTGSDGDNTTATAIWSAQSSL